MKQKYILEKLTTLIFYLSVLFFFIGFNFQDNKMNGWLPQYLPPLAPTKQLVFLDSLTGYVLSGYYTGPQYLLKTTNGGNNWSTLQSFGDTLVLVKMQILNKDSIIICANSANVPCALFKTTNDGNNWLYYPTSPFSEIGPYDMQAFSMDTIWIAGFQGLPAAVLMTTNGGLNWINKFQNNRDHFDKIYFYNRRIGYTCLSTNYDIFKTTNGGDNWFLIPEQFRDIYFIDSLTGWKSWVTMKKTTNGGLNWITQVMPSGGIISQHATAEFSNVNRDTIWACGGVVYIPYYNKKGIIYKTTNGGDNWGYQLPDTNIVKFQQYSFSEFFNKNIGWEYVDAPPNGVHTTVGGSDTTFYTAIKVISNNTPQSFSLKQNYPNPFNSSTIIEYSIKEQGWVKLKIYDLSGKEMTTLVNEVQQSGTYGVPVSVELSSGIYFYKLTFTNKKGEMQTDTKKMVLIK